MCVFACVLRVLPAKDEPNDRPTDCDAAPHPATVALAGILVCCSKSANPRLAKVFDSVTADKQAAFIPYLTAGYPKRADTVDLLLALQVRRGRGGSMGGYMEGRGAG